MIAKCLTNIDPWGHQVRDLLVKDKIYDIDTITVGSYYTSITLMDPAHQDREYNSVMFDITDSDGTEWDFTQKIDDREVYFHDATKIIWDYI